MVSAELVPGWGGTVIPPAALTAAMPPQPSAAPASTPTRPRARPSARNMATTWERLDPKVRSVPISRRRSRIGEGECPRDREERDDEDDEPGHREDHPINRAGLAIVGREILPGPEGQAGGRLQGAARGGAARGGRGEHRRDARRVAGRFQEDGEPGHGLGPEQGRGVAQVHGDRDVVEGRDDRRRRSGYRIAQRVHAAALADGEERDPVAGREAELPGEPAPDEDPAPTRPARGPVPRRSALSRLALACAIGRALTWAVLVLPFARDDRDEGERRHHVLHFGKGAQLAPRASSRREA